MGPRSLLTLAACKFVVLSTGAPGKVSENAQSARYDCGTGRSSTAKSGKIYSISAPGHGARPMRPSSSNPQQESFGRIR